MNMQHPKLDLPVSVLPETDLLFPYMIDHCITIIKSLPTFLENININKTIVGYNIIRNIENTLDTKPELWTQLPHSEIIAAQKELHRAITEFYSTITHSDLLIQFEKINKLDSADFWRLIASKKNI